MTAKVHTSEIYIPDDATWFAQVWSPEGQPLWIATTEDHPKHLVCQARELAGEGFQISDTCVKVTEDEGEEMRFDWEP